METGIHIGPKIGKDSSKFTAEFIISVFESGAKNNMDQETIRKALDVFVRLGEGGNNNVVENCTIGDNKEKETSCTN